jgi:hypothetical protein
MKKQDIVFVNDNSGDWVGIYINGKLVRENHSYEADDMLDILDIPYTTHWVYMETARLPYNLSDVKLGKL